MIRTCRLILACAPVLALGAAPPPHDCPPLGSLPDFVIEATNTRRYDTLEFERTNASGEVEPHSVAGAVCVTTYVLRPGKDTPSNLEIQSNYRDQLQRLGAEVTSASGHDTQARLARGGVETWMRVFANETTIETTVLVVAAPKLTILPPGAGDHRLVGHLPDFSGTKPVTRNFDGMDFDVDDADGTKTITAQGRTFAVHYELKEGLPEPTSVEIRFNYAEALRRAGAEILRDAGRDVTARLMDQGQVVWIKVYASGSSVDVSALEEKPFAPSIKPAEMQSTLQATGRVALYVNFDFDRATLRPDAAPVLAEVAAMMRAEPGLRLAVEGHTDGLGTAEHNRVLSTERARAFVAALLAQGIAADRLTAAGFGPDKPLDSNDTSEGRARNRRVELVRP